MTLPAPDEAREIAAEGWIWGHPLLESYRVLRTEAIGTVGPGHADGFGRFHHRSRPSRSSRSSGPTRRSARTGPSVPTGRGIAVAAPDEETAPSRAWLDLRAEPWVLSVPETDRYYVLPFHDLDTAVIGLVGSRTNAGRAGDHLVAGPDYDGPVPDGLDGVMCAATNLVGCLGRTRSYGPDDAGLSRVQHGYRLRPLSEYTGDRPPPPAPALTWPELSEDDLATPAFFTLLDFLLGFFPVLPSERELRARLARLGVDGGGRFDPAALPGPVRAAVADGVADAHARLAAADRGTTDAGVRGRFGNRERLGDDYLNRAVGAARRLHGLPVEELWSTTWSRDADGNWPTDAAHRDFRLRFAPDGLPPARCFWSLTLYGSPGHRPVTDPADRHSLGQHPAGQHPAGQHPVGQHPDDRHHVGSDTAGLVRDPDGGLTLAVGHLPPDDPGARANWLPAPDGPFALVLRIYGPGPAVLDGTWQPPPLAVTPRHPMRRGGPRRASAAPATGRSEHLAGTGEA
ncbi:MULTISPECIES: DUF1254 domain-containing protein [unclassified Streptomyces]|uniref:DUF1254 domain-containing protein n=1 Tax=unclassified Streptomyces TaxID=2593676 RepID=UPI000CD5C7BE|nr:MULTISPECIES: DUF1254 domain-containing protein [unclassified Streptomyces]